MTREKFSSIKLANMELVYWSVRSFSMLGWDGVERMKGNAARFT